MKSLNKFTTRFSEGFSKTSLMDVQIFPPPGMGDSKDSELLTFSCQSADLPGKTFGVSERKDYVISSKHVNSVSFTDLNLTFLCSSSMLERKFFDQWMELILGTGDLKTSYYDQYVSESIKVNLYKGSPTSQKTCTFTFKKIFPTVLASQNVSWMSEDILKLTVSFSYENWTVEYFEKEKPNP